MKRIEKLLISYSVNVWRWKMYFLSNSIRNSYWNFSQHELNPKKVCVSVWMLHDFKISFRCLNFFTRLWEGKSYSWRNVQDYLLSMNYVVYDFALKTNGFVFLQMLFTQFVKGATHWRTDWKKSFDILG